MCCVSNLKISWAKRLLLLNRVKLLENCQYGKFTSKIASNMVSSIEISKAIKTEWGLRFWFFCCFFSNHNHTSYILTKHLTTNLRALTTRKRKTLITTVQHSNITDQHVNVKH